jgi:hypothetical protein
MRALGCLVALALIACTPAADESATNAGSEAAGSASEASVTVTGPYENAWDSDAVSEFRHTLQAPSAGDHTVTITATTDSPGGETVAVYLADPAGEAMTGWRLFVIATRGGESESRALEFPEGGAVAVVVRVENASGRRFAGRYSMTVEPN